ncbi:hypothetical protein [Hoeflea sp.]|uniref:hypothetical protein n=1 Tax=Hoeflea sp. TaxID=1940281 RepID=UPI003A8FAA54
MTRFAVISLAILMLVVPGQAFSQEPIANRFTMEKTKSGFVRMDTLTGEMSICREQSGQLVCKLAADERRAFEEALSDLSARVAALEQRLDADAPAALDIPDDAELDRALGVMKKMMRGFFGMAEDLRKEFDLDSDHPAEPLPDRT